MYVLAGSPTRRTRESRVHVSSPKDRTHCDLVSSQKWTACSEVQHLSPLYRLPLFERPLQRRGSGHKPLCHVLFWKISNTTGFWTLHGPWNFRWPFVVAYCLEFTHCNGKFRYWISSTSMSLTFGSTPVGLWAHACNRMTEFSGIFCQNRIIDWFNKSTISLENVNTGRQSGHEKSAVWTSLTSRFSCQASSFHSNLPDRQAPRQEALLGGV